MNITDELREFVRGADGYELWCPRHKAELLAIADRIDAEYAKAIRELNGLAEASVLLPKDRDGEYIHIGDVMAYEDNTKPMTATALVPPAVFLTEEGPRYADMCCHYHAPTVEDVLREFVTEFNRDDSELCDGEIIERFAAKLRLAGDEEER